MTIVGSGIYAPSQITLETVEALRRAEIIFHSVGHSPSITSFLAEFGKQTEDLSLLYQDGQRDVDVYHKMAEKVVNASRNSETCFMVHGHPLIYVAPTKLIVDRCFAEKIPVEIIPGVSAIDTMLLQIGIDIGSSGLQIYDCNRLVYYAILPDKRIPLILMQPGCFGSGIITRSMGNTKDRFNPLRTFLLRTYPPQHQCLILASRYANDVPDKRICVSLEDLPDYGSEIDYATSLYLPPAGRLTVADTAMYASLLDRSAVSAYVTQKSASSD